MAPPSKALLPDFSAGPHYSQGKPRDAAVHSQAFASPMSFYKYTQTLCTQTPKVHVYKHIMHKPVPCAHTHTLCTHDAGPHILCKHMQYTYLMCTRHTHTQFMHTHGVDSPNACRGHKYTNTMQTHTAHTQSA